MKNKLSIGLIILATYSLAACQEGLSIPSPEQPSSSNSTTSLSSSDVSSSSNNSSSMEKTYYPINSTSEIDIFSNELVFNLDMSKITMDQAEELVTNDISKYPAEKSTNKRTSYTIKREESHVTENRTTATYSVKDIYKEKFTVNKTDADNNWSYRRSEEHTRTVYFVEDTLIRHSVIERLYFVKDNYLYNVYAEESYYEGMENKGTYEAYYTKTDDFNIDEYGGWFGVNIDGYAFFNSTQGLSRISRNMYDNLFWSSSYYTAEEYADIERETNYEFYSSNEKGNFGCIANDKGDYPFSNLRDYPSMEKSELSTISYSQDYLLNIKDYFTYDENAVIKSVSKSINGEVIRNERKENRKKVMEGCELFYPDLSKFEEREITPPITK